MLVASVEVARSPNNTLIQKTVQDILLCSRLRVTSMEDIEDHLHRIYKFGLSNGSRLVLKLSPSATKLLLRHERRYLESEASILALLHNSRLPMPPIPRVLMYDPRNSQLDSPFLLTTHLPGIPFADALPYLTKSERRGIELQLQSLSSVIGQHCSTKFGPAALVAANKGFSTWREAFKSMLASVLMDGEDMVINLPYTEIRESVVLQGDCLDEVREAKLMVMGLGRPENVLIDRRTNDITGVLDFGQAVWGDEAMTHPQLCCETKALL